MSLLGTSPFQRAKEHIEAELAGNPRVDYKRKRKLIDYVSLQYDLPQASVQYFEDNLLVNVRPAGLKEDTKTD